MSYTKDVVVDFSVRIRHRLESAKSERLRRPVGILPYQAGFGLETGDRWPCMLIFDGHISKGDLNCLVSPLRLTVCLGMVGRCRQQGALKPLEERLPELREKLRVSITYNCCWYTPVHDLPAV